MSETEDIASDAQNVNVTNEEAAPADDTELNMTNSAESNEETSAQDIPSLDDEFSLFMTEVSALPSSSNGRVAKPTSKEPIPLGTPLEQVIRLTAKIFTNAFEVLLLQPDATDEEIKKQFRKVNFTFCFGQ